MSFASLLSCLSSRWKLLIVSRNTSDLDCGRTRFLLADLAGVAQELAGSALVAEACVNRRPASAAAGRGDEGPGVDGPVDEGPDDEGSVRGVEGSTAGGDVPWVDEGTQGSTTPQEKVSALTICLSSRNVHIMSYPAGFTKLPIPVVLVPSMYAIKFLFKLFHFWIHCSLVIPGSCKT